MLTTNEKLMMTREFCLGVADIVVHARPQQRTFDLNKKLVISMLQEVLKMSEALGAPLGFDYEEGEAWGEEALMNASIVKEDPTAHNFARIARAAGAMEFVLNLIKLTTGLADASDAVYIECAASQMSKAGFTLDDDGKEVLPARYRKPDVLAVLRAHFPQDGILLQP